MKRGVGIQSSAVPSGFVSHLVRGHAVDAHDRDAADAGARVLVNHEYALDLWGIERDRVSPLPIELRPMQRRACEHLTRRAHDLDVETIARQRGHGEGLSAE
jgi:hypothetical protein